VVLLGLIPRTEERLLVWTQLPANIVCHFLEAAAQTTRFVWSHGQYRAAHYRVTEPTLSNAQFSLWKRIN